MRITTKLIGSIITTAVLTACGQNQGIDSNHGGDNNAPAVIPLPKSLNNLVQSRMINRSVLFAEVILRYDDIEEVVTASRQADTDAWEVNFRLPSGRDFSLDVTWYDTADGARLDLVNFNRDFNAVYDSGPMNFDFSNYDFDGYDADSDGITNLAEREAGTSPLVANGMPGMPGCSVNPQAQTNVNGDTTGGNTISNDDGDVAGSQFFISGNNSARLSGPVIGCGTLDNASIRKRLSFTLSSPSSEIEIRQVYATRSDSEDFTSLIAVIQNTSNTTHCFIRLSDMVLVGDDGSSLETQLSSSFTFADSSVASVGVGSIYTSTCLIPGEKGYVLTLGEFRLDDLAEVSFGSIQTTSSTTTSVNERVLPLSYTINGSNLDILVANQSSVAVQVDISMYIVLDDQGFPLTWGFGFSQDQQRIQPGAETIFSDSFIRFDGSASTLRVIVDFELAEP